MLHLDTLAYTNGLRSLPPAHKLLFAAVVMGIALVGSPLVQITITLWLSFIILFYAKIPLKAYLRLIGVALFFCLSSLPALLINIVPGSTLAPTDAVQSFPLGSYQIYLSYHGCVQALIILCRTLATVACMYFVILTVPFTELLATLRRLGLPSILADLLLLMYRFIFILLSTASELWLAQQSRNGYRTRQRWIFSLSLLITQLFHKTMAQYHQFLLSTAARGFNGEFRVWSAQRYQVSKRYMVEACLGCGLLAVLSIRL
jgi:cobalt/nickel transport system permease protein